MPDLTQLVSMLIICFVPVAGPHDNPVLQEAWRLEKVVPLDQCLVMDRMASGGGKAGVITVRCGDGYEWKPKQ